MFMNKKRNLLQRRGIFYKEHLVKTILLIEV